MPRDATDVPFMQDPTKRLGGVIAALAPSAAKGFFLFLVNGLDVSDDWSGDWPDDCPDTFACLGTPLLGDTAALSLSLTPWMSFIGLAP